jgi:hypothetical protein
MMLTLLVISVKKIADQNQSGGHDGWEEPSRLPKGKTMTSVRGFRSPIFISTNPTAMVSRTFISQYPFEVV